MENTCDIFLSEKKMHFPKQNVFKNLFLNFIKRKFDCGMYVFRVKH